MQRAKRPGSAVPGRRSEPQQPSIACCRPLVGSRLAPGSLRKGRTAQGPRAGAGPDLPSPQVRGLAAWSMDLDRRESRPGTGPSRRAPRLSEQRVSSLHPARPQSATPAANAPPQMWNEAGSRPTGGARREKLGPERGWTASSVQPLRVCGVGRARSGQPTSPHVPGNGSAHRDPQQQGDAAQAAPSEGAAPPPPDLQRGLAARVTAALANGVLPGWTAALPFHVASQPLRVPPWRAAQQAADAARAAGWTAFGDALLASFGLPPGRVEVRRRVRPATAGAARAALDGIGGPTQRPPSPPRLFDAVLREAGTTQRGPIAPSPPQVSPPPLPQRQMRSSLRPASSPVLRAGHTAHHGTHGARAVGRAAHAPPASGPARVGDAAPFSATAARWRDPISHSSRARMVSTALRLATSFPSCGRQGPPLPHGSAVSPTRHAMGQLIPALRPPAQQPGRVGVGAAANGPPSLRELEQRWQESRGSPCAPSS